MSSSPSAVHDALVPSWVPDAVFYQIFPDRFCRSQASARRSQFEFQAWGSPPGERGFQGGDLRGIAERLDHLQDLGVTALYLNPIFTSAANHRYHTFNYFEVDPLLGGNEALRGLLDAVHARGMRLILDGVFNHVGRGFWPFHHVIEAQRHSPYADWFHIRGFPIRPFTTPEAGDCNYETWWGLPELPKLNLQHPAVRQMVLDVARHWVEFGIDGWRLDVPEEIPDPEFWRSFRNTVKSVNADAYIVGEIWGSGHGWLDGDRFDGITNYEFSRLALAFFAGDTLHADPLNIAGHEITRLRAPDFAARVERMMRSHEWEFTLCNLNYLDSHDMPRILHLAGGDLSAIQLMLGFQMTMPGVPILYYGTEIGMTGGHDPECRRAFPWDAPHRWERGLLEHCRWLIGVRHQNAVLRHGRCTCLHAQGSVLVYKRFSQEALAYVVYNASQEDISLAIRDEYGERTPFTLRDARQGTEVRSVGGCTDPIQVPRRSMQILIRQP